MRSFFVPRHLDNRASLAILLLRVVCGLAFVFHGTGKIQNPFGWMGPEATMPGLLQALAALSEFGGGIAWMIGLLTPLASLGILCTMVVAAATHILKGDPFVGYGASYELAAVYLCVSIVLILVGAGKYSLDQKVFRQ